MENFGFYNSLCACATQNITNYTPIGEYCLYFFPKESFECPCKLYSIETRHYIIYDCRRFGKEWNSRREIISQFIFFLENNLSTFFFGESIIQLNCYQLFLFLFYFIFIFPSFLFLFLFSFCCSVYLYIYSYEVAIMVYYCALYNKLLI